MYINVKLVGGGERTLVLSHGYGGSQEIWDKVVPYLTNRFQVLLFDWDFSGSGETEEKEHSFSYFANDLISLMDEMKLSNAIYIGHSMSGMIGCIASFKRPDLFNHLVLIGASPRYLNSIDYQGGFERDSIEHIFSSISSNFDAWAEGFVHLAIGVDDPDAVAKLRQSFFAMNPNIALAVAKMIFLGDQREVLEKVEVPCTIIQVSDDFAAPVCVGRYMQEKIKGEATLEIIESKGHFPQLVAHHKLLDILDRVLLSKLEATKKDMIRFADMEINGDIDIAT